MPLYSRKPEGVVFNRYTGPRHPTKHIVKQLSGDNKGSMALFDTEEGARAECFWLADNTAICCARYEPLYSDH